MNDSATEKKFQSKIDETKKQSFKVSSLKRGDWFRYPNQDLVYLYVGDMVLGSGAGMFNSIGLDDGRTHLFGITQPVVLVTKVSIDILDERTWA